MKKLWLSGIVLVLFFYCLPIVWAKTLTADEYFNQASLQYLMGNSKSALVNLRAAIQQNPQHKGANELLNVLLRANKISRVTFFSGPGGIARLDLDQGKQLIDQGELLKAQACFQKVLAMDSKNEEALKGLEQCQIGLTRQAEAKKQAYLYYGLGSIIVLVLVALIYFLVSKMWRLIKSSGNYCFNCHARISSNIDLCPNCGAWIGSKLRVTISDEQKAWYGKLGWRKNPFTLDVLPELFTGYRNEVKMILEKLSSRSGHILITGPLGAGKTTLLRWLTNYLRKDCQAVYVPRPPQEFSQLIKVIMESLGVDVRRLQDYDLYHLDELRRKAGRHLVILLDEAHEFTIEIERPLRTLGDLDGVNLVMAGLPETTEKFRNEIQPLYERLVLKINLGQLAIEDIKELVRARIENVGGKGTHPFTVQALDEIYLLSHGNPRSAVKICDWAVTKAINLREDKISLEVLNDLAKEVNL